MMRRSFWRAWGRRLLVGLALLGFAVTCTVPPALPGGGLWESR